MLTPFTISRSVPRLGILWYTMHANAICLHSQKKNLKKDMSKSKNQKYRKPAPTGILDVMDREVHESYKTHRYNFICPCGDRVVSVKCPPHEVTFDERGWMSIKNSCGYSKTKTRPENWCHFSIKNGVPIMHEDSQCNL